MTRAAEPDPVEWVRERWEREGFPEPERFATVASMMRAHQVVTSALEQALKPFGLTRTMYLVLVTLVLSEGGARKMSYLSRYLMVHQTTITQLIDQLEKRGLVRRAPHPTDRRTTLAVLTDDGRALVAEATTGAGGFGVDAVDPETLSALTEALRGLRRATGDL